MAYADLAAALQGDVPSLSYLLALQHIKRAYRDILDARTWGFLAAETTYICPPEITAGSVAITQGSGFVTLDATAIAAVAGWPAGVPLVGAQIRFAQSPLYTILDATMPTWTLDRPVAEADNSASAYELYLAYLTAPTDFKRWDALVDSPNGLTISGEALTYGQQELDLRDPQRLSVGQASYLAWATPDASGTPRFELWPHPTSGQTWWAHYRRTGVSFTLPTDTQPSVIPDALILQRAYGWYTYPWAAANAVRLPGLGGNKIAWTTLILEAKRSYQGIPGSPGLFAQACRADEEQTPQQVWNRGSGIRGRGGLSSPVGDSNFWQRHPIFWLLLLAVGTSLAGRMLCG